MYPFSFFFISFSKVKLYFIHTPYLALILLIPNPRRETVIACNIEIVCQLLDFCSFRYVTSTYIKHKPQLLIMNLIYTLPLDNNNNDTLLYYQVRNIYCVAAFYFKVKLK